MITTNYRPRPGDKVKITGRTDLQGSEGIITGVDRVTPAAVWLYVQLGNTRTVKARNRDLQPVRSGGSAAYNLAMKAARLRAALYRARTTAERDRIRQRLYTTNYLISILARNTGGAN